MEDRRREHIGVDQRVEQDGRDEVGRGVAPELHRAQRSALQADVCIAGEQGVAVEAALLAGVRAQEAVQVEDGLQAGAKILGALDAEV